MDVPTIQAVLETYVPGINVKAGSPMYHLFCKPLEYLTEQIDTSVSDDIIYDIIPGRKATGALTVTLSNTRSAYNFLQGYLFTNLDNILIQCSEDTLITEGTGIVPVETVNNTSQTFPVDYQMTSSQFSNLVTSCYVSTMIAGGSEDVKQSKFFSNSNTIEGLKNLIKQSLPILDAKVSGKKIQIKSPLQVKSVTSTSTTITIQDNIVAFKSLPGKLLSHIITNVNTQSEQHTLIFNMAGTISYYSAYLLGEVQEFIDNQNYIYDLVVEHAPTALLEVPNPTSAIKNYINQYPISTFDITKMITDLGLVGYDINTQPIYKTLSPQYETTAVYSL